MSTATHHVICMSHSVHWQRSSDAGYIVLHVNGGQERSIVSSRFQTRPVANKEASFNTGITSTEYNYYNIIIGRREATQFDS